MENTVMGPLTDDTNEFAAFELARLGYDVRTKAVTPSTEDADDLLDAVLGEELDPKIVAGVIWAIKNRPIDWAYRFASGASDPKQAAHLDQLLTQAEMTHVKENPTSLIPEDFDSSDMAKLEAEFFSKPE